MSRTEKQCFVLNYMFKTLMFNHEKESGTFLLTKKYSENIFLVVCESSGFGTQSLCWFLTARIRKPASHIRM